MRSTPWYHQKRSESAPPVERLRDPPALSQKEQDSITDRISRPTESALYRQSLYWKLDSFMDRGFHSWSKMDLFDDCKRCMWKANGTIKPSCKIRPLQVSRENLPPLRSGRSTSRSYLDPMSSSRSCGDGNGRMDSGSTTSRTLRGGQESAMTTQNRTALSNGLAMLGGVNGARYKMNYQNGGNLPSRSRTNNFSQYPANVNSMAVPRVTGVSR